MREAEPARARLTEAGSRTDRREEASSPVRGPAGSLVGSFDGVVKVKKEEGTVNDIARRLTYDELSRDRTRPRPPPRSPMRQPSSPKPKSKLEASSPKSSKSSQSADPSPRTPSVRSRKEKEKEGSVKGDKSRRESMRRVGG